MENFINDDLEPGSFDDESDCGSNNEFDNESANEPKKNHVRNLTMNNLLMNLWIKTVF